MNKENKTIPNIMKTNLIAIVKLLQFECKSLFANVTDPSRAQLSFVEFRNFIDKFIV